MITPRIKAFSLLNSLLQLCATAQPIIPNGTSGQKLPLDLLISACFGFSAVEIGLPLSRRILSRIHSKNRSTTAANQPERAPIILCRSFEVRAGTSPIFS